MPKEVGGIMQPIDKNQRDEILTKQGNIAISASAGTGKTYMTVQRIIKDLELNKTYKTFAAITFTRKAAKEIILRLGSKKKDGFLGTNDNFILLEIIQPFMYDAYGNEFKIDIMPNYSRENSIYEFQSGINMIKSNGKMCKYKDNNKNFAFELALNILKKSHSARRFLKAKYYKIYIDEYQDSDVDMHNFFKYIYEKLEIPLFIVGDEKQSIYGWRGAYSQGFKDILENKTFNIFQLYHNFRSNEVIQNYSNMFMSEVQKYFKKTKFNEEIILLNTENENNESIIKNWVNINKKCTTLNYRKNDAKLWSEALSKLDLDFKYIPPSPLDYENMESEHVWIVRTLANYCLQKRFTEYDFYDEIPSSVNYSIIELRNLLIPLKENLTKSKLFKENTYKLYKYLGYDEITEKIELEIEKVFKIINDNQYILTYNQDDYELTSITIHSSKGLEFDQVILNASDYALNNDENRYLHYVAISRPKNKLLIIAENINVLNNYKNQIEKYLNETNEALKNSNIKLEEIIKIIE